MVLGIGWNHCWNLELRTKVFISIFVKYSGSLYYYKSCDIESLFGKQESLN